MRMTPNEHARTGLEHLKEAILGYLRLNPQGVGNSQIARDLGLESDFQGKQKQYLSWSVIGLLVNEGKVVFEKRGRRAFYKLA
jgi:hypothetical protein